MDEPLSRMVEDSPRSIPQEGTRIVVGLVLIVVGIVGGSVVLGVLLGLIVVGFRMVAG